ncbi:MAG: 2'-5' RNA ligase family protein [Anaerolineales bacterium]|nr:2'-5' RNA ligase family protein [Anaerolineales bacterium]
MHGLVSLLDQEHTATVEHLWMELELQCGLTGIKVTPFPHFSWLIAEDFDWDELAEVMAEIAAETKPFTVRTTGLALFTGEQPVVYIPVVCDSGLSALHERIWAQVASVGMEISSLYSPQTWMPHISLAYVDVTRKNIDCVMQYLAFHSYDWQIEINNITVIHEPAGTIGVLRDRHDFTA